MKRQIMEEIQKPNTNVKKKSCENLTTNEITKRNQVK